MTKSESLQKLVDLGLNTVTFYVTKSHSEARKYLNDHSTQLMSIRTERGSDFLCPFYFKVPGKDLIIPAMKEIDNGYTLIISDSIDTKGGIAFGTVGLGENADNVMEVVEGEGLLRELDNHPRKKTIIIPKISIIAVKHLDYPNCAHILNGIYLRVKEACYDEIPCIVEWSYYNRPIGRLGTQDIYWELRPYA